MKIEILNNAHFPWLNMNCGMMHNQSRRVSLLSFVFIMVLSISSVPVAYGTSAKNITIYSPDSGPHFGFSYAQWTGKWWQWFIGMPDNDKHPFNDPTGANCARNQQGPVWFLAGSNGHAVRTCVVPQGKAILFPTINNECSTAEDTNLKTESDLRNCAVSNASFFKNFEVTIDGLRLDHMERYNVVSPVFDVTFPSDHPMFTAHPGPTRSVSAGNWVFLGPLSPGSHEIHYKGQSIDFTGVATHNFAQDGTYHLLVQ
jgi:hypothetical protein